ncbi:MAG: FAD-linked oxidase C-terminal domain-containing protein, partial [Planctomycetaceae bacterium]
DVGGRVTGEHGIGVETISFLSRLFTEDDLAVMHVVRRVFNPDGLCSPGKLLPVAGGCNSEHPVAIDPARRPAF